MFWCSFAWYVCSLWGSLGPPEAAPASWGHVFQFLHSAAPWFLMPHLLHLCCLFCGHGPFFTHPALELKWGHTIPLPHFSFLPWRLPFCLRFLVRTLDNLMFFLSAWLCSWRSISRRTAFGPLGIRALVPNCPQHEAALVLGLVDSLNPWPTLRVQILGLRPCLPVPLQQPVHLRCLVPVELHGLPEDEVVVADGLRQMAVHHLLPCAGSIVEV